MMHRHVQVALAMVAIIVAVVGLSYVHERTMVESFSLPNANKMKALLLPLGREGFTDAGSGGGGIVSSAPQLSSKTQLYMSWGHGSAFCSGTEAVCNALVANFLVFFSPSEGDLMCKFGENSDGDLSASNCSTTIDKVSCTDRTTPLPPSRTARTSTQMGPVVEPTDSQDCILYLYDGIYRVLKTSITMYLALWPSPAPSSSSQGQHSLVLPSADFGTRLFMMLQPMFVRVGRSKVYRVVWPNDLSYDSDSSSNAVLALMPVPDAILQSAVLLSGAVPPNTVLPHDAGPTLRTCGVPRDNSVEVVCYYLKFQKPNTALATRTQLTRAASIFHPRVTTTMASSIVAQNKASVLSVSRVAGPRSTGLQISVPPSSQFSMPALDGGMVVVTRTHDIVIASSSTRARTVVRRFLCKSALVYRPAGDRLPMQLGYTMACVPCMADLALRCNCLSDAVIRFGPALEPSSPQDVTVMLQGASLVPGQFLTSADRKYMATYQSQMQLAVYRATDTSGTPLWASRLWLPAPQVAADGSHLPGRCTLGANGVLSLQDSTGATYWVSQPQGPSGAADLGPFRLVLTNDGHLQVLGSHSSYVVWDSSVAGAGLAVASTFKDASDLYKQTYSKAVSSTSLDPWNHYLQYGRLMNYFWPGPHG